MYITVSILIIAYTFFFLYKKKKEQKQIPNHIDEDSYYSSKTPPTNLENAMIPPWQKYDSYDIGRRKGNGEDYMGLWLYWYGKLTKEDKIEYQHRYPEPKEADWRGFYEQKSPEEEERH